MHKPFIFLLLAVILFSGCVSEHKIEEKTVEPMSEDLFLAKGKEYIDLSMEHLLFGLMEEYGAEYPLAVRELTDSLVIREMERYTECRNNADLFGALFSHNNLSALATVDPKASDTFYRELARDLYEQSYFALSKYYRTVNGYFVSKSEYTPLRSIAKYNDILAEINIIRTYKTETGLVRKSYPYFSGSGFLVGPRRLVTAYHVIEEVFEQDTITYAIEIVVRNKRIKGVTIKGWDSLTDIALLELPEEVDMPYKFYKLLGDSTDLRAGYEVYCLGHHSGYTQTLTRGIVSSVERKAPEVGTWIQVDAAVSPGASGGLLVGKDNLVYGMIVAGIMFEDINFAVPSNVILEVLDRLERAKRIDRPWLGILCEERVEPADGVVVFDVFPSSPLAQMNVRPGDRIAKINGKAVQSVEEAQGLLYGLESGNMAKVSMAEGEDGLREFFVLLGKRPDYPIYNATRSNDKLSSLYPHFGFEVLEKPIRSIQYVIRGKSYTLPFYEVSRVLQDSYLDSKGVRIGDYIGFIDDFFRDKNRYIELLHIPKDHPYKKPEDVGDHIYVLKKSRYDENVL